MLEETADEFQGVDSDMTRPVAVLFAVRESNVSIFDSHDSGVGDGDAEDIRSEILQGSIVTVDGFAVDIPSDIPDTGIDFVQEFAPCHFVFEFGSDD